MTGVTKFARVSNTQLWENLFLKTDVSFECDNSHDGWKLFLSKELTSFRHAVYALDSLFITFYKARGFAEELASEAWSYVRSYVETHFGSNVSRSYNSEEIRKLMEQNGRDGDYQKHIFEVLEDFKKYWSDIISSNMPKGKNAEKLRIGGLGELLAYLFARDLDSSDCIYHKLTPDNPEMARHGLDLLAVKFDENPNLDMVNFWEAKATSGSISWCRDEIINWFNIEFASRVNMAIEAAKNEWRYLYPLDICRRACSALCRYQATKTNHRFIGSIAHDYNSYPSEEDLKKFKLIEGSASKKQVVLFSIKDLSETANEVFALACST